MQLRRAARRDRSARVGALGVGAPLGQGLSARQYELLEALSIHPERVIAKADLARRAWGWQSLGTNRTLDIHASRARSALRRAGAEGFVINCRGVGYKLWNGSGVEF